MIASFRPPPLAPAAVPKRVRRAVPRAVAVAGTFAGAVFTAVATTLSAARAPWFWYAAAPAAAFVLTLGPAWVYFLVRGEDEDGFANALYSPWVLAWLVGGTIAFLTGVVLGGGRGPLVLVHGLIAAAGWSAAVSAIWWRRARRRADDAV